MDVEKSNLYGDPDQHGKLWVKLQLPKKEEDGVLEDERKSDDVIFTRICQVCGKGFKSGKALGGHMRVHFQTHKGPSFSKKHQIKKSPEKRTDFFLGDDKNNPKNTCSECGKNFPSPKSLFGHMRCHPDRDWRGIRPPFSEGSSSVVSDDGGGGGGAGDNEAVESGLGADLVWSVTAKRGRKSLRKVDKDDEEKKLQAAVFHLLSLADEKWDSKNNDHEQKDVYGYSSEDSEKTHDDHDHDQDQHKQMNLMKKGKRRARKKMKLSDLDHGFDDDHAVLKFKCTTCGRSFPTHQALGGHRSSHKFKMLLQAEDVEEEDDDDDEEILDTIRDENQENNTDYDNQEGVGRNSNHSHVCRVCNKNFPSGQALGGHKRCHRISGMNEGTSQSGRALEFDLNEEPPMEFDDQNAASCSNNSVEYPLFAR